MYVHRIRNSITAFLVALTLSACGLTAPRSNDGFADLESLDANHVDTTMVLSLGPTLLRLAARYVDDDPQTKALLSALDGVRVRVYEVNGDAEVVASDMDRMSKKLREQAWEPVVLVQENGERTHMLMKTDADRITGLTVLTSDGHEAVVVNVMGNLQPEMFSEAMVALELETPDIELAR
jgi:hypothetical protein